MSDPTLPPFPQSFVPNGPSPPAPTNAPSIGHTSAPPASNTPLAQSPPTFPGIHIDGDGTAWYLNSNGQWQRCQHYKPLHLAPSPSQAITPSAARLPNFAPAFGTFTGPPRASGPTGAYPALIDPGLIPLPPDADGDLSDPPTIAKARGLKPAGKVGGVRQHDKGKGKKRARSFDTDADSDTAAPPTKQRGRPKGSANFSGRDVDKLLDLTQLVLPLAGKGWKEVTRRHNEWSEESNRPMRSLKSLEHKFKTLVAMKKPTGDGHCPPDVKRAKRIDRMITERAGTRDIDDSDLDDGDDDDDGGVSSDDSVKIVKPTAPVHTAVARRAPSPPLRRNSRLNAPDLVNKLAKVFDPETQQSLQEERSQRSFQNTQLFTLMQQLRDAQAANDNLRYQVTTAQNQAHESDRARDRAEFKLQMYEHGAFGGSGDGDDGKGKRRSRFQCTGDNGGDSDKENWNPSSSSGPSSFPRSSSPSDFTASFDTSSGADGSAMVAGPSSSGVGSSATNNARAYSVEI